MKNACTLMIGLLLAGTIAAQPLTKPGNPQAERITLSDDSDYLNKTIATSQPNDLVEELGKNVDVDGLIISMNSPEWAASLGQLLEVYPNPSNGLFRLKINDAIVVDEIAVYDLTGRKIIARSGHSLRMPAELEIDLRDNYQGIYLLVLRHQGDTFVHRLVKN